MVAFAEPCSGGASRMTFRQIARALSLASLLAAFGGIAQALQVPAPVGPDKIALHVINVDQGAASLVETPCGTLLIDAGGRTQADTDHLMAYLQAFFAARPTLHNRFAAVFLTHPHPDHDKSMLVVDAAYEFDGYIDDGRPSGDGNGVAKKMTDAYPPARSRHVNEITFARTNKGYTDKVIDPLVCSGTKPKIRVLAGGRQQRGTWTQTAFKNTNNHSLVIRIDYGRASFLFLGDLETEGQRDLVAKYAGTGLVDVDVLFVPHHGADNGATTELLAATTPKVAIVSSGDPTIHEQWTAWDHGHPRVSSLDRLQAAMIETRPAAAHPAFNGQNSTPVAYSVSKAVYDTAWDGDIVVTAAGDGALTIATHR